tara:strand:+ start:24867 stop:25931 length:1065 start_codon:yes stop_codon:yes gene_type:complete
MCLYKLKFIIFFFFINTISSHSQTNQNFDDSKLEKTLFESNDLLSIKLSYSRKQLKKETNDSTFLDSFLAHKSADSKWDTLRVKIRARGNFRRAKCHFTPVKLKIKKSDAKKTIFKGQKQLKMVLPCVNESSKDDNVIKEYIIYKMFEVVSPYYFSSRLLDIEYSEIKKRRTQVHNFKGLMIEDNSKVAKRLDAKLGKRKYYPQAFDELGAVRHAMFQFMIGNTDFSTVYQHNTKVLFVNKRFFTIPYDFDMAGFVNTSYAVVSQIGNQKLPIDKVIDRYYRGYKHDYKFFQQVREEFIDNKEDLLQIIDDNKLNFIDQKSYKVARVYILDFFKLIGNESTFKKRTYLAALELN